MNCFTTFNPKNIFVFQIYYVYMWRYTNIFVYLHMHLKIKLIDSGQLLLLLILNKLQMFCQYFIRNFVTVCFLGMKKCIVKASIATYTEMQNNTQHHHEKVFKNWRSKMLLGPFLNTLCHSVTIALRVLGSIYQTHLEGNSTDCLEKGYRLPKNE